MISELGKATTANSVSPFAPFLSELPDTLSVLQPPAAPLSPAKEDEKSEVIIVPFKEKPITGRGDSSSVFTFTFWTSTELRALAKEFPDPSQDPLGFSKEFELAIQAYKPGLSDLYQLIQLLVSESKAREWRKPDGNTPYWILNPTVHRLILNARNWLRNYSNLSQSFFQRLRTGQKFNSASRDQMNQFQIIVRDSKKLLNSIWV